MAFGVSKYAECALIGGATKFVDLLLGVFISKLTGIRKKKRSHLDPLSLAHVPKALFFEPEIIFSDFKFFDECSLAIKTIPIRSDSPYKGDRTSDGSVAGSIASNRSTSFQRSCWRCRTCA